MDFYGEQNCQAKKADGQPCKNKAYYRHQTKNFLSCGVHCKGDDRLELPVNPDAEKIKEYKRLEWLASVEEAKNLNGPGKITLQKMYMMKNPPMQPGILNVFPNYMHANRTDGIGMSRLSPKSLGPVDSGQPGLPIALNLENFHQSNKCFAIEVRDGKPSQEFFETQRAMYLDPKPHRHKLTSKKKNIPEFSVWIDKDGSMHLIDYITSRQFYCNFYERLVQKEPEYHMLKELIEGGTHVCICGYDAFVPDSSMEEHYLDKKVPFGHELVLYTMLTEKPENYPWRKYKTFEF